MHAAALPLPPATWAALPAAAQALILALQAQVVTLPAEVTALHMQRRELHAADRCATPRRARARDVFHKLADFRSEFKEAARTVRRSRSHRPVPASHGLAAA